MNARAAAPPDRDPSPACDGTPSEPTIQDRLDRTRDWRDLEAVALALLDGEIAPVLRKSVGEQTVRTKTGLLRWALSDAPAARSQWEALSRNSQDARLRDRDRYVEALWRTVELGPNDDLRRRLENAGLIAAYRDALFTWFLRRFDLGAALRLFTDPRRARLLRWGVPPVLAALAGASLALLGLEPGAAPLALFLVALALAGFALTARELPPRAGLQALVPRLGAGVALGYLFLAAAPDLVRLLAGWGRPALVQWLVAASIVAATWLYSCLHVLQRVQPVPPRQVLVLRAWSLVWTGLGYTAVGLTFAAPVLFADRFLGTATAPHLHTLVLIASIALALGVVLELAWEEKPLTEPL
jgi:hypothetical protein